MTSMVINCRFDEFDDEEWWDEDVQVEVFQGSEFSVSR